MALVFLLESGIQVQRVLLWLPQEIKIYILLMSLSDWGTFYGLMDKVFGWKPWQHRFDSCPPQSRDIYIGRILMTSCSVFSSSVGCIEPNILWWLKKKKMGLLVVAFDVSHSIGGTAVVFETGVFTSSVWSCMLLKERLPVYLPTEKHYQGGYFGKDEISSINQEGGGEIM